MLTPLALLLCLYSVSVQCFIVGDDGHGDAGLLTLAEPPLKIASFNIQVFGRSKSSKLDVIDILVKILSQYDIIQIMEIRDASQTAFEKLRVALNNHVTGGTGQPVYEKVVSGRLGRTRSKEQYGFLYRSSKVSVLDTYQSVDSHDYFQREPFSVRFKSPTTVIEDFAMSVIHIQPTMAAEEMDNLTRVYDTLKRHWHLEVTSIQFDQMSPIGGDIIIGGDFNAGCHYMSLSKWKHISLRTDSRFEWLVGDGIDTTVSASACSYDRFVVAGSALFGAVVPGSVHAYRFDEVMGLTKEMGLKVSDHYPIEMQLEGKRKERQQ